MSQVDDNSIGGFYFIWKIQYCGHFNFMQKHGSIQSPTFVMNTLKEAKWHAVIHRKENENIVYFLIHLLSKVSVTVNVEVSVRETNGLFKNLNKNCFTSEANSGNYILRLPLFNIGDNAYLDNDEMTLRCRMWKDTSELLQSVRCYAVTKLRITKIIYMWKLKNVVESETGCIYEHSTEIPSNSCETFPLKIDVVPGVSSNEEIIELLIQQIHTSKPNFITCKVSLLDADDRVAHAVRGEHFYEKSGDSQIWRLPIISKQNLLQQKDLFLPNDTLSMRLEFACSTGALSSKVKRLEYGTEENDRLKYLLSSQSYSLSPIKSVQRHVRL